MRKMPPMYSRKWWELWLSGAISPREQVLREAFARHIESQEDQSFRLPTDTPQAIRNGEKFYKGKTSIQFRDACVRVSQDLRIAWFWGYDVSDACIRSIFPDYKV
jgi:hypothetical protein